MSSIRIPRLVAAVAAAAVSTVGLAVVSSTTAHATTVPTAAVTVSSFSGPNVDLDDATLLWGINGYAQEGIFGPWTFSDVTGNAEYLAGNVSGDNPDAQTEYLVDPVPATSFPTSKAGKSPNAVKFNDGTGTRTDDVTTISWTGSYTINAYPDGFGAPSEIYSDPELTIEADGSGTLTMDFTIGAGTTMGGEPFEAQEFGRLDLVNFSEGSIETTGENSFRLSGDYEGVVNNVSNQNTTCTTDDGATGWWGSWPVTFINAMNSHASGQSVLAHFYSTGCGGKQDNKPPLPVDVSYTEATTTAPFTDIEGLTFEPEITWLAGQNITTGYDNGDGTFAYHPSDSVLREQMAAFLYRFEHDGDNPAAGDPAATFTDVPNSHVFSQHIAWLASTEITTGYVDGTYRPSQPVLREQMAAFLYRLAGEPAFEAPTTSPFTDIPTSHTFYKEITWLASTEITTGYEESDGSTTFRGSAPVLREQMAAFLFRYNNLPS